MTNEMGKLIERMLEMKRPEMMELIVDEIDSREDAESLVKLLSLFHDKAHQYGWKSDGTCGKFDRMMLIMMLLGQNTVKGDARATSTIGEGKLLSRASVDYVLSGLTNPNEDYYNGLSLEEQSCIHKIAEHAINERMKSMMQGHIDNGKMMEPVAMDGNMLFEMVMNAALMVYRTGRHGQMTEALNQTFVMTEDEDEDET